MADKKVAWRERLISFLFSTKKDAFKVLRVLSVINSVLALMVIIVIYGFPLDSTDVNFLFSFLNMVILTFILTYCMRVLYSLEWKNYLRKTWKEALLVIFIVIHVTIKLFFDDKAVGQLSSFFGIRQPDAFYELIVTIYISVLAVFEIAKSLSNVFNTRIKPTTTFLLSFVLLISLGTAGFMLPEATTIKGSMPFIDAFFTATSASCVTGLAVVDTATYFTFKGKILLLIIIQIGGLGIVTFATFFAVLLNQSMGIKHQTLLRDTISGENLSSTRQLLINVIGLTLLIECCGAVAIFFSWGEGVHFNSLGHKLFFSVFHSISAFCNAGFSLYSNGLYEEGVRESYVLHFVLVIIIILGGIGFSVMQDFSRKRLRERLLTPWKDWQLGSKIAIHMSFFLIVVGTILFFIFEYDNTLKGMNFTEKLIASLFQSVTTRTAGFNTVDMGAMKMPTIIIFLALMLIGASPLSTGGGIKTTTVWLVSASFWANIIGKKKVEYGKRAIPNDVTARANAVFIIAILFNFLGILLLSIFETDIPIMQLVFEQVSAFGTAGLSTGITADLSIPSKLLIIVSMFLGRVGTITLALALSKEVISDDYELPKGFILVG